MSSTATQLSIRTCSQRSTGRNCGPMADTFELDVVTATKLRDTWTALSQSSLDPSTNSAQLATAPATKMPC